MKKRKKCIIGLLVAILLIPAIIYLDSAQATPRRREPAPNYQVFNLTVNNAQKDTWALLLRTYNGATIAKCETGGNSSKSIQAQNKTDEALYEITLYQSTLNIECHKGYAYRGSHCTKKSAYEFYLNTVRIKGGTVSAQVSSGVRVTVDNSTVFTAE